MSQFCNYNKSASACYSASSGVTYDVIRTASIPHELTNALGKVIGYTWHEGESIALDIQLIGTIDVENDAIVYTAAGQAPETSTTGIVGQKAYNVHDEKSWTCTAAIKKADTVLDYDYIWELDDIFTYPENSSRDVYIDAADFVINKKVIIKFFNFRYEEIYNIMQPAESQFTITTQGALAELLTKGLYYMTITLYDGENLTYLPIIENKECSIVIE